MKEQDLVVSSPAERISGTNKSAESAERRKSGRFAVSATAEMLELRTRTQLTGRASDLGVGGCYVDTVTPFPVGTVLMLNLSSANHSIHAKTNVIYAHKGMGMGLAFTEMEPNQRTNLSAWLRELSGELPNEERASGAEGSYVHEGTIQRTAVEAKVARVLEALEQLVSSLRNKGMLTENEVELLREKMTK